MSFTENPGLVPDRDSLPLKKRDQKPSPPPQQHQQPCDETTFKAPFPYRSHSELKTKHTSPFQPVPRRVPALYQPWMQTLTSPRSKPHVLSAFREHHAWADWRDYNLLQPRWDLPHQYQHHSHLSPTLALHPGYPQHISQFNLLPEGFQSGSRRHNWEHLRTIRDKSVNIDRQSNGRNKGPYLRRRDRKTAYFPGVEKVNSPSSSTHLPLPENFTLHHDVLLRSAKAAKHPGHSLLGVSSDNNPKNTYMSMKEDLSRSSNLVSPSAPSSSSSSSANQFPWLLPHFVAGSLIELRDGRLRRVEHLQTEDFLLGSLACPDLCLSSCTVQSISPSSSSSISRLLILLHNQHSQELVDVYVEYPFFVRGQGWSSCSPQKTARLCGLQCRQLSVGDVCLALTPVSAHRPLPSANLEPKSSPKTSEGRCESPKAQQVHVSAEAGGRKKETEAVRRRHYSAPELRGSRTNCLE
ncbi:uncharacterized protein LOC141797645 [Halichoeres trimaculatus]|uniref:uncharacterized protein LOC141797645 n=1 Tax=Halichoeres trimaculatus TaxID=147232 RepID=UPI003D9EC63B